MPSKRYTENISTKNNYDKKYLLFVCVLCHFYPCERQFDFLDLWGEEVLVDSRFFQAGLDKVTVKS